MYGPYNQASFKVTDVILHHKDLPTLTKEAAGVERSGPTVLAGNRWKQNVPWL
jgi:hypothetical protein